MSDKPVIAVSACLVGEKVLSSGDAAEFQPLSRKWSKHLELIPICPEVGIGMGVPRPSTRLIDNEGKVALVNPENGEDYTKKMSEFSQLQSDILVTAGICGFVFKTNSPTCGLGNVSVYQFDNQHVVREGRGIFAMVFTSLNPHIPTIEERRLTAPKQAEHFLSRVHFFHEWKKAGANGWDANKIMQFHNENKLFLLSRAPHTKQVLGRMIARRFDEGAHPEHVALEYITGAQKALNVVTKKGRIAHTMERVLGKLSHQLSKQEKQEVVESIHGFRQGILPRSAPLEMLNHYLRRYNMEDKIINRFISSVPLEMRLMVRV